MKCPECQNENPKEAKFCMGCGHNLASPLTPSPQALSFDAKIDKIQRYLPEGLAERILSQKDKIEGERRQVTVMFCDMEGFTPLVGKLGPEEAYSVMDQVYEILIHKVHDYEGTVNEMTGDGVMALFGAPIALEDGPQRALRSALSIHRDLAEFNKNRKGIDPVRMRIGVNTGHVVVGTLGNNLRVEFKAVGDTVNLASRMEALAEPGTTYVTENTFRLTDRLFRFEAKGKKAIKGIQEPIPVYRVLSAREDFYRPRLGSERMIFSEMVGRDEELDRLELQVMKAVNGEGSVVNIIGEAGIGKSRLVAELKKREVMNRVTFLEGRAIPIGRNLSFYPVIDLFKQWAQIREEDDETMAFRKLQASMRSLFPEELGEVLPFVATLIGMKLPAKYAERVKGIEGEALENLILQNLRKLLVKATEMTPLVIVTEDLHWADTSSIELLESLFRLAETRRILFINVFRPGAQETGDRIVKGLKERLPTHYVEIVLEPLDERMGLKLITNMLSTDLLHHNVIRKILQRAGGNPFFIEEVVRSFIDEGALVLRHGKFRATAGMNIVSIPNTIDSLLMARIDRLDEHTRELVKIASVIGRNFFYRILADLMGKDQDIDTRLAYLKEIEIIRERERMGEIEYLFKHALAQEAVYDSILPPRRKELHLQVAGSIEKVFAERLHEFYGMLAYHSSRAESPERTEEYLIKAGEEALKSSASNEALHYYQEALSIYRKLQGEGADPEKVAMLEKNIGLAFFNRGHYPEAVEHFDKALSFYWGELPNNAFSTAIKFVSSFTTFILALYFPYFWFKRLPTERDTEAITLFAKKAEALVIINPKRVFIETLFFCGTIVHFDFTNLTFGIATFVGASGIFSFTGLSQRLAKRILDYAKPRLVSDNAKQWILYDIMDTSHHFLKGQWNQIRECDEHLVKRNLKIGEIALASQHYYWHALPKIYQGHFDAARLIVTELSEIAEAYDNDIHRLLKYLLNIQLHIESRNLKEAAVEVKQVIELVHKNNWRQSALTIHSLDASISLLKREMKEAENALTKANQIRSEVKAVPIQLSFIFRSRVEYYLRRLEDSICSGHREEISEYRRNAVKSGKMLIKTCRRAALFRTESYRLMGLCNWLLQDTKTALKWWHKATSEGERIGAHPQVARTYAEMGTRLCTVKRGSPGFDMSRAKECIEKAKTMFCDLGLNCDLQDLNSQVNGIILESSCS